MSFILDALKKSENERQRQVGPSLADVPVGKRRNDKPWWAVAVAALLVVNLGVLLIVLTRNGDAKPATPQPSQSDSSNAAALQPAPPARTRQYAGTQIPETTSEEPSSPPARSAPPSPAVRSLADEAGNYDSADASATLDPHLAAAATVPEGPPLVRPIEAPSVAPARPGGASRTARANVGNASANDEVLPTISDVTAGGTTLPELHLDIHVSSANAAERFVFVNMRKYSEGQALNEGPIVEKITADGVILNHQGLRFLLPRQ